MTPIHEMLGAKIKNVVGLGERSAAGLSGEIVVLVVQAPRQSAAATAGLREGDVILACNGKDTNSVEDLLETMAAPSQGRKSQLEIWRNQQRTKIELSGENSTH